MNTLDYRDSRPLYEQIADQLRRQITGGILREGDQLPSVRETAASMSINPNTIQRAYRLLEQGGWIVSVPGKGSFVCQDRQADPRQGQLLLEFEHVAKELIQMGVSPMELVSRLTQLGGNHHA